MTIGLAVLPVVATVAAFASRRVRATAEGRAFVIVGVSAFVAFVTYAAVKGAFLSTVFSLPDRRAKRDLPRPDRVRRDGGGARAPDRDRPGAHGRLPRRAGPDPRRPSSGSTSTPTSRPRAWRSARWRTATSSGTPLDVERALVDRRAGLGRAARGALVRPLADGRARARRRRRLRGDDVGADDRDLRVARPQHLLRADAPDLAQARRLGRPGHGRRADALPRPAARQGHEPDLAARVLELRDRQDLEPRRHGAAAVALTRPRRAGRNDEPRPGRELGRDRQRRRGRRREGRRAARRDAALARAAARPLPEHPDRHLPGRLDELERDVLPVRARGRRLARLLEGRRLPAGSLRQRHPDGRRHRPDRARSPWSTSSRASRASTRSSGASSPPAA